jgi:hypothetical protein
MPKAETNLTQVAGMTPVKTRQSGKDAIPDADTMLLGLCREFIRLDRRLTAAESDADVTLREYKAVRLAYLRTWRNIMRTCPNTMSGLAAKSRLAFKVRSDEMFESVARNAIAMATA